MKKIIIIIFLCIQFTGYSQNYNTKQLKIISEIWGECYLFHPSVVRSDQELNWEQELVKFLPQIKQHLSNEEFIDLINSKLLSTLNDPLTQMQLKKYDLQKSKVESKFQSKSEYDYYRITEDILMSNHKWIDLDSIISDKISIKPLIFDLRIESELVLNPHEKNYIENLSSILIESPISYGSSVSREHFGWDEYNDWWYYEQKWKIENNGNLNPLKMDAPMIQYQYPEIDLNSIETIHRPVYLIINKSFISYYYSIVKALKLYRPNTYIIFENSGKVYAPWYSKTIKDDFDDFEFVLNPTFAINNNFTDLSFDYSSENIETAKIEQIIKDISTEQIIKKTSFKFDIIQEPYITTNKSLSAEERILGIIKTWTIIKYFYVHENLISENWNDLLEPYLYKSQQCNSDKEYYELIQNMMSKLNDSHVSTYHPSILDFSKIFVASIQFEWIENKVIITAITPEIEDNFNIRIGDEITSIDDKLIPQIIKEQRQKVSASNDQSFYSIVINPGNFIDAPDKPMRIRIKRTKEKTEYQIPRTIPVFQFIGFNDNRLAYDIKDQNIGYLNLAALTDSYKLENELIKMQNTKGLVIDLRNGYPTNDYSHFIELLTNKTIKGRISETPIICANKYNNQVFELTKNEYQPDSTFIYTNPIAVLIDKSMVSRPEDIAIALKEIENIFFVGEQTQGTDGEMSKISLPGGGETSFTGEIIKFANGDKFQGNGIIPDFKVEKTVNGVKKGKDEILEAALKIIAKKISTK